MTRYCSARCNFQVDARCDIGVHHSNHIWHSKHVLLEKSVGKGCITSKQAVSHAAFLCYVLCQQYVSAVDRLSVMPVMALKIAGLVPFAGVRALAAAKSLELSAPSAKKMGAHKACCRLPNAYQ